MIKCMFLLRRKPGLGREEFADYWARVHSHLALKHAEAMGIVRYVQCHAVDHAMVGGFAASHGAQVGDFDGMAEVWWDSFEAMAAAAGSMPHEVAAAILADESCFVDTERSIIWFAEEKPFWPIGAG
jgi:uncharacterized protein (TIGR02118 family)